MRDGMIIIILTALISVLVGLTSIRVNDIKQVVDQNHAEMKKLTLMVEQRLEGGK